jgi:ferredoxin
MTPFNIRKKLRELVKEMLGGGDGTPASTVPQRPRWPVTFELPDGTSFQADARERDSLVLASGRGPRPISTGCADGTCSTCQVVVLAGEGQLSPADEHEVKTKADNGVDPARRLGCQTAVLGPGVHVKIINVLGEDLVEA